ncbi:MAG: tetratricopeptide repeat protein [Acidobacteria bacterium]|nr:tetratricopeptide repeat protein [Acidobacteriota bacterium]
MASNWGERAAEGIHRSRGSRVRAFSGGVRRIIGLGFLLAAVQLAAASSALEEAGALYQRTEYRKALGILLAEELKTAPIYALIGKCYYGLEDFKKATEALQRAVAADPQNSHSVDWLGKAFGRRAETSSFLTAPSYASQARKYFEQAVELDPQNQSALDDLFDYYLEAPGFLGGGQDKAAALSERVRERNPAKYHSMQARLAEKKKQFEEAEKHWRQAVESAPSEAGRLVSLARFLARQGRYAESEEEFEKAARTSPENVQLKFERAKTYVESKRNLGQARKLLQEYLNAPLTPDDPPRSEARKLLQKAARS